jgi:hypothetical protein
MLDEWWQVYNIIFRNTYTIYDILFGTTILSIEITCQIVTLKTVKWQMTCICNQRQYYVRISNVLPHASGRQYCLLCKGYILITMESYSLLWFSDDSVQVGGSVVSLYVIHAHASILVQTIIITIHKEWSSMCSTVHQSLWVRDLTAALNCGPFYLGSKILSKEHFCLVDKMPLLLVIWTCVPHLHLNSRLITSLIIGSIREHLKIYGFLLCRISLFGYCLF